MKRILIALFGIIIVFSLFSCKDENNEEGADNSQQSSTVSSIKSPWGNGNSYELPEDEF